MKTEMAAEKRRTPAVWIATVAGAGYFPVAPGTIGSTVGVGIAAGFEVLPFAHAWREALLGLTAGLIFFLGVWAAGESEKFFGRVDPRHVVIDEVVGQMITFLLVSHLSWKLLLAGFGLFRLVDVTKPFPARRAERLPGGWGIMVDDVVAGAYSMGMLVLLGYMIR